MKYCYFQNRAAIKCSFAASHIPGIPFPYFESARYIYKIEDPEWAPPVIIQNIFTPIPLDSIISCFTQD